MDGISRGQIITNLLMARALIQHASDDAWSFQGFGMFRMYLSPNVRLHVWVPALAYPNVSTIHTHPWDFTSTVLQGRVRDTVYDFESQDGGIWESQKIKCGPGGGPIANTRSRALAQLNAHVFSYTSGCRYALHAAQIHATSADAGTITIIKRRPLEDAEHASVFYEKDKGWVSAEPRPAIFNELARMRQAALSIPLPLECA